MKKFHPSFAPVSRSVRPRPVRFLALPGLIFCAVWVCACADPGTSPATPRVQQGVLDLRGWTLTGELSLDGDWGFAWGERAGSPPDQPGHLFAVPGFWNDRTVGPHRLTAEGFAAYSLRVLVDEPRLVALRLFDLESAFVLYANGKPVAANGTVGESAAEERPEWRPLVALVPLERTTDLVLVVSNFHHRLGGIWQGPTLGAPEVMFGDQRERVALELFLAGSLLMVGVYHCLVFFVRRKDRAFLLLGIFCVIMCLRSLVIGERFILTLFPEMSWDLLVRLDYLTVSVGMIVSHWEWQTVFRAYYKRWVFGLLVVVFGACGLAEVLLPPRYFTYLMPVHGLGFVLWSLYFLGVICLAVLRGMPGAGVLLAGWIIAVAAGIHDTLFVDSIIKSRYLFAIGLQAFVLTQSYYLASQYAQAFSLSEVLTERMRSLLAVTRELNRSGERDSAIWTALDEIHKVTRAMPGGSCAYVPVRDARLLQKITRAGAPEAIPVELSAKLSELQGMERSGDRIFFPLRGGDEIRCVLEMKVAGGSASAPALLPEAPYVAGILDSLALVLDNIERVQKDELARIGQAAAEIVHDINHICVVIGSHAQTARDSPSERQAAIAEIDRNVDLMRNLATDILDYARERLIVFPKLVDVAQISALIEEELAAIFHESNIEYTVDRPTSGTVRVDAERFRRVVLNLARNALAALGGRGRFSVAMEHQAGSCCFLFEDNGPGIAGDLIDRLFEPFASAGRGTGLGLAVVKRIVLAHGGDVRVGAPAGGGCRILVELPDS